MDDFLGIIIVGGGIFLGIFLYTDSNYWANEVTVYKLFHYTDKSSNPKTETMRPITYKTLNDKQVVIYWLDGSPPSSYENCAVRDYKNWQCFLKTLDLEHHVQMVDGKYSDDWGEGLGEIVPKWKWWITKFNEWTS